MSQGKERRGGESVEVKSDGEGKLKSEGQGSVTISLPSRQSHGQQPTIKLFSDQPCIWSHGCLYTPSGPCSSCDSDEDRIVRISIRNYLFIFLTYCLLVEVLLGSSH